MPVSWQSFDLATPVVYVYSGDVAALSAVASLTSYTASYTYVGATSTSSGLVSGYVRTSAHAYTGVTAGQSGIVSTYLPHYEYVYSGIISITSPVVSSYTRTSTHLASGAVATFSGITSSYSPQRVHPYVGIVPTTSGVAASFPKTVLYTGTVNAVSHVASVYVGSGKKKAEGGAPPRLYKMRWTMPATHVLNRYQYLTDITVRCDVVSEYEEVPSPYLQQEEELLLIGLALAA